MRELRTLIFDDLASLYLKMYPNMFDHKPNVLTTTYHILDDLLIRPIKREIE